MSGTPSGRIVAAANAETVVVTENGRKLMVRRLGALDRSRLFKAIGADNAVNGPYLGMAMLASSVTQIDETPCPFPTKDSMIEAAIARLEDDGINAVAFHFAKLNKEEDDAAAAAEEAASDGGAA